ncbi:MAG TPA: MoaD/ThiS family protein [Candidatus Eremiobacteraceae bacterium]|nr:MoaD/ThiS family protein [Candidatus Eremiobacteraceae bacterium]
MTTVLPNLRVKVLFFGPIRELTGASEEAIEVPVGATLENVFHLYCSRFPRLSTYRASLVASQNQDFASWDSPVTEGDTIAFLPPVSGG